MFAISVINVFRGLAVAENPYCCTMQAEKSYSDPTASFIGGTLEMK